MQITIAPVLLSFPSQFLLKNVFCLSKTNHQRKKQENCANARTVVRVDLNERVLQNKRQIFFYYRAMNAAWRMREKAFYWTFQEDNKKMNVENERTRIFFLQSTHIKTVWLPGPHSSSIHHHYGVESERETTLCTHQTFSSQPTAAHLYGILEIHDGCFHKEKSTYSDSTHIHTTFYNSKILFFL